MKRLGYILKDQELNLSNKEIVYERKFPDNKGIYYYPLKRNFASIEEEKNYIHYYGEDNIDRVSRLNDSITKKENFIQDDVVTNYIFTYLINNFQDNPELVKIIKSTLKIKHLTKNDILKRTKLLYDRYHGLIKENSCDFWFMSCKQTDNKNLLTLFQNNKQLYCNIDNIYDCNIHTAIDSYFDNPSCYDQIKYLQTYKILMEFSLFYLEQLEQNSSIPDEKEMINDEIIYHIDNNDSISNTSTKNVSNSANSNTTAIIGNKEDENTNINEINIENKNGIIKTMSLLINGNYKNIHNNLKFYIIKSINNYNQILKNLKCEENLIPPIKNIKQIYYHIGNNIPCSDLCYKNLLLCDEELINKAFKETSLRKFPLIYELIFIKFFQMIKYDPCHIYKLMKQFIDKDKSFKVECYEIYFHLINSKYDINKVIKKNLFELNLKEKDSRKTKGLSSIQSRKLDEKNSFKNKYLPYTPCAHFGNEVCDKNCICSDRGFCEKYCKCNKLLCKFSHNGCHCVKGDCCSNHCACYINARECDPVLCKNCNKNGSKCKNKQLFQDVQAKIIVGISKIAGWGLFANEDIRKDALIGEYKGELINEDITNKRDRFKIYENSTYMFTLDDEYTIDSRKMGNMLRYANHSKKNANSYPRVVFSGGHHRIGLFAKRHIYKGEEIKFDYDGQNILSKQFPWINDDKEENSEIPHIFKKKKSKKKLTLIGNRDAKKNRINHNEEKNDDIKNDIKNDSNLLNNSEEKDKLDEKKENKDENENNKNEDNKNEVNKNEKNRIIRIINDDEGTVSENNKINSFNQEEVKKKEEKKNEINNNDNNKINNDIPKPKPLSVEMIAKTLLSRKRCPDKIDNNEFVNKKEDINEKINKKAKIILERKNKSIQDYFKEKENNSKNKNIKEKDSYNMLFRDKPIKLIENKDNLINYDLGTIRVMINFENPIIADFSFFGPKNTDFFKKYDILKFQSLDILDTINLDLNNDIYGYLVNGNFNRGHLLLVSYLNFYEKRIYFYRNDNLGINIYIFGKGKLKNLILQKCGLNIEESRNVLTFLIKTGLNNKV